DPLETFQRYRATYGGIFQYYYFTDPVVVVSDPKLVHHVLHDNPQNYPKDRDPVIIDVIGNGLLLQNGDFWKRQRKLMNPAFSNVYLQRMMSCFIEVTDTLMEKLQDCAQ